VLLLLLVSSCLATGLPAASIHSEETSGSYPGRVLGEILRHRQAVLQRARQGIQTQRVAPPSAAVDVGQIAVLPDDGTLVTVANSFDLDQKNLLFQPAAGGYTVLAGAGGFDAAAAAQGLLLNPPPASNPQNIGDDGTRLLSLGFSFPYFGTNYTSVFVNSDGNLTFGAGDNASTARSLGRFLAGPPRVAPYFADLDPSVAGQLTYLSTASRFVVTWSQVPDYASAGIGPRETFQVSLTPDGMIQFAYSGINGREAVVGLSPGGVAEAPAAQDLSMAGGDQPIAGAIAEVFTATTELDLVSVAQRFYQTHEDSYQALLVFTTFDFNLGGAFAFEINIANDVTGIGPLGPAPTFDFSGDFGSERLESMLNMGNLARYPADPSQVFLRGVDSTLSILSHEAGHRFLSYIRFRDPETQLNSTGLLGRDLQHWSFFFNSEASVLEGNRIRDNGDGTFTTTGAVQHYSELDQYIMGLRAPGEVSPSFLVKNPSLGLSPGAGPASQQITFAGHRVNVTVEDVIAANGPRIPNHVTARKRYNYAFILVTPRGSTATDSQVAHLDRIRRDWEPFYAQASSFRSTASTSLVRQLEMQPKILGLFAGAQRQVQVEIAAAAGTSLTVQLANSNPAAVSAPSQVLLPAGSTSAPFTITALSPGGTLNEGRAVLSASAPGFETADLVVQVTDQQSFGLSLEITGGNHQVAAPGDSLPELLEILLSDANGIPYAGQSVSFSVVAGDATVNPPSPETDADGRASTTVQLGATTGSVTIRATVDGTLLTADFSLTAMDAPAVPQLGALNAASYALSPPSQPGVATSSPGALISIFGTSLSAATTTAPSLPLQTTLGGSSVIIDGVPAPLLYVSPLQINAQVPYELAGGVLTLTVRNAAGDSTPIVFVVQPAFPGIFTFDASGTGPGAILHNSTGLPVTDQDPIMPGEFVQIFTTGLGRVSPGVPSGLPAGSQPPSMTDLPVTVTVNGVPAAVPFAGLAPGFAGLYQVNAQVPEVSPGSAEVVLSVNGVASQKVTMAVGSN
jgi:uncharacterized protein (TIGR03437 family)